MRDAFSTWPIPGHWIFAAARCQAASRSCARVGAWRPHGRAYGSSRATRGGTPKIFRPTRSKSPHTDFFIFPFSFPSNNTYVCFMFAYCRAWYNKYSQRIILLKTINVLAETQNPLPTALQILIGQGGADHHPIWRSFRLAGGCDDCRICR